MQETEDKTDQLATASNLIDHSKQMKDTVETLEDDQEQNCSYTGISFDLFNEQNDIGLDTSSYIEEENVGNSPPMKKMKNTNKKQNPKRVNFNITDDDNSQSRSSDMNSSDEISVRSVKTTRKRQTKIKGKQNFKRNVIKDHAKNTEQVFFQSITAAANSIAGNKTRNEPGTNKDGIIDSFCEMQKYLLKSINEDAYLAYIREATVKLTDLCAIEKHIL